jgi:catechol 2,3-dioxygenase-like lactoylglutathione lyase family enzyme
MPVRRIVPDLHASDVAASRELYVDVLGLDVAMDLGWVVTYAAPGSPKTQITVMADDATAELQPAVSIEVDDVDAVHAEAVRRGYAIVHPLTDEAWGVRRFFVRDAGGNVLNILSHGAEAGGP